MITDNHFFTSQILVQWRSPVKNNNPELCGKLLMFVSTPGLFLLWSVYIVLMFTVNVFPRVSGSQTLTYSVYDQMFLLGLCVLL